ncbi:MAG: NADH-quinone oxidoreductase subunit N [Candidatus Bathyarchaeota archaeon]|nr:NADH-quinone oxidoreductase subunit N [Candidatus Bathyarchaeota archaeon]
MELVLNFLGITLSAVGLLSPTIDYVYIKERAKRISFYLTSISLIIASATLIFSIFTYPNQAILVYNGALRVDFYGIFLALIATIGALLVVFASSSIKKWSTAPSFYSLLLLGLLGVYYLIFVNDFVLLIAAWALVAVTSYVIAGIRKDARSVEGAVKYAIMGALASVLLLFAVANIYSLTGTTNIGEVISSLSSTDLALTGHKNVLLLSVLLFISALGFKIGIVPFHGWLPDVYGGVHPIPVSFLAGVVKIAGVAVIIRILFPLASLIGSIWLLIFALLSIFTMTFGNIVALVQSNVQRMMAYSSIAHVGYILTGVTAISSLSLTGKIFGIEFALPGIAIHLLAYSLAKVGIFVGLAFLLRSKIGTTLDDLKGIGRSMPTLSISILILLFSLMGVPPLLGFWGKFYLFTSVVSIAPWLAFIALINSGLSVGYYAQVIRYMFFMEGEKGSTEKAMNPEVSVLMIAAILTIVLGILVPFFTIYLLPPYPLG